MSLSLSMNNHRGKATWGHSEKVAIYQARRKSCPECDHTGTLILKFQPPEL